MSILSRSEDYSLCAYPDLASAQKRETDKSADIEFLAIVDQLHAGTVDLAIFRIQNLSALIFLSLFRQIPQDGHADHWLIVSDTRAFITFGVWLVSWFWENFFNSAFVLSRLLLE